MALKTNTNKQSGAKRERVRVPDDTGYPVLIVGVMDLGAQFNRDWKTQEIQTWPDGNPKINQEIRVTFEFPTVKHEFDPDAGPQPLWIAKTFNIRGEAAAKLLRSAGLNDEGSIDFSELAGKLVAVDVESTSGGNAKITNINRAKKKMVVGDDVVDTGSFEPSQPPFIYDLDAPDKEIYDKQPDFIKEMLDNQASPEVYKVLMEEESNTADGEY